MKSIGKVKATLEGSGDEIVSMIEQIRLGDKTSEGTASKGCWTMGIAVIGGGGLVMGLGSMFPSMDGSLLSILTGIAVVAFIVGAIIYTMGSSGDVDDSRYEALERLHNFLEKDCAHNATFSYQLDLRPLTDSSFYTHKEKFGGFFSLPRGTHSYYTAPVVTGDLKLRDGTRLQVELSKMTRKTVRTKRGRSKVKTKTKYKYKDSYTCRIKLPPGSNNLGTQSSALSGPNMFEGRSPKFKTDGNKALATMVRKLNREAVDPEPLLKMLVCSFQRINEARATA